MSYSLFGYLILAQGNRLEQMGRGMRAARERVQLVDLWPMALALLVIIVGVTAYKAWKKRNDFREKCNNPKKLFRELCAIHELNVSQRLLLSSLAEACEFDQPAQVFLVPSVFEYNVPAKLSSKADQLRALRTQLF
ncbi:hypothetical protein [Adhaeretor mobilis]|uniref:Uncharacterized protein n=1 Tax=Adhaeretor mobilis TaxID=1930276 RepID=A0A517MXR3_9BACT|nr:hypothetical protein [Adhaeretor mobilis]QDS99661.1 hypothetical protein HG15A2_29880 [Adhaeretor mobilis]